MLLPMTACAGPNQRLLLRQPISAHSCELCETLPCGASFSLSHSLALAYYTAIARVRREASIALFLSSCEG